MDDEKFALKGKNYIRLRKSYHKNCQVSQKAFTNAHYRTIHVR